jgi:FAD/FMN-containing dehydrogenase
MKLTRRAFSAGLVAAPAVLRFAHAATAPLSRLPNIAAADATLVTPGGALYDSTLPAYNLRTELRPALRILCKTIRGVAEAIAWVHENNLAFALRSGGHSFEGFSQSAGVVIDTRLMNTIALDAANNTLSVGAGASLGDVYRFVAPRGLAFPGGSCPTVGISGHTLGGGFGLLARARGLACDSLTAIDLIDADAKALRADARTNADLFWACRGGGGGTFGAVSALHFQVAPIGAINVYSATWALPVAQAADLFRVWQAWAPTAPDGITGIFKLLKRRDGKMELHIAGQSIGSKAQLRRELRALTETAEPSIHPTISAMSYMAAVNHFAGGWRYESKPSKGKSDYVTRPLDAAGIDALVGGIAALPANQVIAICDAYGGAIAHVPDDATAFAYRAGTLFCIQYYTSWLHQADARRRLADLGALYAALRPYSGGAYVNYCDRDLPDWQHAYWRQNLTRLQAIKSKADPENFFHHAQSVR